MSDYDDMSILDLMGSIKSLAEETVTVYELARAGAYGMLKENGAHGRDLAEMELEARRDARELRLLDACPYSIRGDLSERFCHLCYVDELNKMAKERGMF